MQYGCNMRAWGSTQEEPYPCCHLHAAWHTGAPLTNHVEEVGSVERCRARLREPNEVAEAIEGRLKCWLRRPASALHRRMRWCALLIRVHLSRVTYHRSDGAKGLLRGLPSQAITDEVAGTRAVVGSGTPTRTSSNHGPKL